MRRVAVVGAAVLLATSVACTDAGTTPLETVGDAVARTLDAQTVRASFTVTAVGPLAGREPVRLRGEGAFDVENRIGSMTVTAVDLSVPVLRAELSVVSHGPVQFLRVPPGVPVGQAWVVVDHRTLGDVEIDPLRFDQLLAADPSTGLRWLRGAGGDVSPIGTEEVRGVATTRFGLTIDLRRAAEQAPSDLRASMGRIRGRFERTRFPAEVWIGDDDGRIRRLVVRFEPARAEIGAYVFSEELFAFGTRVAVAPPTVESSAPVADVARIPPTTTTPRQRRS
jgi:hypothetical protein